MGSFLGSVSSQQKFEAMDIKALGQTVSQLSDRSMSQLRVTAQFYLENKGKYIPEAWKGFPFLHQGYADSKDAKRRERRESAQESDPWPFGSSFCFSLRGPALGKLGQPGVLFVLTEVPTPVFGPSFVLFSRAFPFFVF